MSSKEPVPVPVKSGKPDLNVRSGPVPVPVQNTRSGRLLVGTCNMGLGAARRGYSVGARIIVLLLGNVWEVSRDM